MFEPAEVGAKLSKHAFDHLKEGLRLDLVKLQQDLREPGDVPVILVVTGIPGAGVVDTVNLLNTWMDPRWIATTVFDAPTEEERERPPFWRYWRSLPAAGTIGLYLGGWYEETLHQAAVGSLSAKSYAQHLGRIADFERTLSDDGALIVKIWLHLGAKAFKRRRKEHRDADALVGLRPTDTSLGLPGGYDRTIKAAGEMIETTLKPGAPWHIVEGTDDTYRRATVLGLVRTALADHLKLRRKQRKKADKARKKKTVENALIAAGTKQRNVLSTLPMPSVTHRAYQKKFHALQRRIYDAHKKAREIGLSTVLAFEGWDAAGKGGAIRRLSYALNARNYKIIPISAPTDEEMAHHYLWRFWRQLQRAGRMTIFDRSWYGRVLVERVDKLIPPDTWTRAYSEINAFEKELCGNGTLLLKFWIHITRKEQLKRFETRADTPTKSWKLTADDWRNRKKWNDYETAVNEMVAQTSTELAPWHLISGNDKHYARIQVLEILAEALDAALTAHGYKAVTISRSGRGR